MFIYSDFILLRQTRPVLAVICLGFSLLGRTRLVLTIVCLGMSLAGKLSLFLVTVFEIVLYILDKGTPTVSSHGLHLFSPLKELE